MLFEAAVRRRGVQAATRLVVVCDGIDGLVGVDDEIFSVKLKSRSCPEQRGFVRVTPVTTAAAAEDAAAATTGPPMQSGKEVTVGAGRSLLLSSAANQQQQLQQPIRSPEPPKASGLCLSCNLSECVHVAACLPGIQVKDSVPLAVKQSVLNSMSISAEWKHKIWLRARGSGPLAQRVSLTTMVVKCDSDVNQAPLGYLHTTFVSESGNNRFRCDCDDNDDDEDQHRPKQHPNQQQKPMHLSNSASAKRCIHFYSCLAVFLSDAKLSREFDPFVQDDQVVTNGGGGGGMFISIITTTDGDDGGGGSLLEMKAVEAAEAADLDPNAHMEVTLEDLVNIQQEQLPLAMPLQTLQQLQLPAAAVAAAAEQQQQQLSTRPDTSAAFNVQWRCVDWISGLTEMINSSYSFLRSSHSLTVQAPQAFFDVLKDRMMSSGGGGGAEGAEQRPPPPRRRPRLQQLPTMTTEVYTRTASPPFGSFTKHIWHLVDLLQVRKVFDTPSVQLQLSQHFVSVVANNDGVSYERCAGGEHLTYLKVGPAPFVIEWTPDIFPVCGIGELTVKYQCGNSTLAS